MSSGRWAVFNCSMPLRSACVGTDDTKWIASEEATAWMGGRARCPPGYTPGTPTNGYSNALLRDAVIAETVWLSIPAPTFEGN